METMTQRILVIDDDDALRDTVAVMLEQEGFKVYQAGDGPQGLELALKYKPELAVVDLRLPGLSGVEICKRMRKEQLRTAIVILSAVGDEFDKVLLLEIGADDYVVKPFGRRELLARIRAVLRRSSPESPRSIAFGETDVDLDRRTVTRAGIAVRMTPSEYNLLVYFLQNPDRPLTRDMILNSVWGYDSLPNTRTVDAHVVKLRQKLEPDAESPRHFVTVHGVGYRFLP